MTRPDDSPDELGALDREIERLESVRDDVGAALDTFYSEAEIEARREARIRLLGEFYLDRPLDANHLPDVVSHAEKSDEAWLFDSGVLKGDDVAVEGGWETEGVYDDPDDFRATHAEDRRRRPYTCASKSRR